MVMFQKLLLRKGSNESDYPSEPCVLGMLHHSQSKDIILPSWQTIQLYLSSNYSEIWKLLLIQTAFVQLLNFSQ